MKQMGVDSAIYGVLTQSMALKDESEISLDRRIHPKIEPEIAFITRRELSGIVSIDEALDGCEGVCAAMEIIDSRYLEFKFELPDVIADNCSSSGFVLGRTLKNPREIDLGNLGMLLEVNGKSVQFGASSAILGHPAASLVELVRMLSLRGRALPAGSIVLAGSATAAIPLEIGMEVKTIIQDLGAVTLQVGLGI
jgi:2-oxo-3-hexenedioate decarboxylase